MLIDWCHSLRSSLGLDWFLLTWSFSAWSSYWQCHSSEEHLKQVYFVEGRLFIQLITYCSLHLVSGLNLLRLLTHCLTFLPNSGIRALVGKFMRRCFFIRYRRILILWVRFLKCRSLRGKTDTRRLRILQGEAFEIVEGALELFKNIFREVTVSRGVVLQVERIQNDDVWVLQAIQLVEWPIIVNVNA